MMKIFEEIIIVKSLPNLFKNIKLWIQVQGIPVKINRKRTTFSQTAKIQH